MKSRSIAIAALLGLSFSTAMVVPTHAVPITLDASGVDFNFANPGGLDRMVNVATGSNLLYTNVATIDGIQIDARVTVGDVSADLIGTDYFAKFGTTEVDMLNGLNPAEEDDLVPGCYSNAAYVADQIAESDSYFYQDFVASDRLPDGRVGAVDVFEDDATDSGINTSLFACTNMFYPSTATSAEITIDFEVGSAPVTLTNLTLNVQDIDGGQNVTFSTPRPSLYELTETTQLEVSGNETYTRFLGVDPATDDPDYAVDVTYLSTSTLTYAFGLRESAGGGGVAVLFEPFLGADANEGLAPTGSDEVAPNLALFAGVGFLAVGTVIARRRNSRRAASQA